MNLGKWKFGNEQGIGEAENVESRLPTIQEGGEGGGPILGRRFREILRNGGGRSSIPEQQGPNNEMSENVELEGAR